jgi:hypothetical protein
MRRPASPVIECADEEKCRKTAGFSNYFDRDSRAIILINFGFELTGISVLVCSGAVPCQCIPGAVSFGYLSVIRASVIGPASGNNLRNGIFFE